MNSKKNKIILLLITLLLGFLLTRQFYLHQRVKEITESDAGSSIALEVTEYIKTNDKLRKQIAKLQEQKNKLEKSTISSQVANETLRENLQIYKIILGLTDVEGPGIEITFNEKVHSTQIIDLINAVKNIGVESIAINNCRFTNKSFVETGLFYPPTTVQMIGDADMLKDSLVRGGGIIDQIGSGEIEKKDKIFLKSI